MKFEKITGEILDACITVHKLMGPGLLESIYEECLLKEFRLRGIEVRNQVSVPLIYKGYPLSKDLKIDILVANEYILELKSVEIMHRVYEAQILSYLKLTGKCTGFLVNFNVPRLVDGFRRFVN